MLAQIKKFGENHMFWIGFQTAWLIQIFAGFIKGEHGWKYKILWGTITILLIGIDKIMLHNKEEE